MTISESYQGNFGTSAPWLAFTLEHSMNMYTMPSFSLYTSMSTSMSASRTTSLYLVGYPPVVLISAHLRPGSLINHVYVRFQ